MGAVNLHRSHCLCFTKCIPSRGTLGLGGLPESLWPEGGRLLASGPGHNSPCGGTQGEIVPSHLSHQPTLREWVP